MRHHYTTDPGVKAHHIASMLEKDHEDKKFRENQGYADLGDIFHQYGYTPDLWLYDDWPYFYLKKHDEVLHELTFEEPDDDSN